MVKLIAMAAMLIDHIGAVFFPEAIWLRIIGRISFPLFAWGIAVGFIRTRNWKIYAVRLLAVGLITQLPYSRLFQNNNWNVCFTLLAGLVALKLLQAKNLLARIFGMAGLLALVHFLDFEYGIYGVLTILIFYFYRDDRNLPLYQGILTLGGILVYRFHEIQLFSVISSFLIPAVRRNDYQLNRLVQYGFYPVHIVLLLIIKTIAELE